MSYYSIDATHKSPNYSSRNGASITMVVLHATVGDYAASLAWLTNPASKVSTHYLISKTGHIAQLVPDAQAAWHAGVSAWYDLGSAEIQAQSLGIELENANDGRDPYPAVQLGAVLWLSKILVAQYHIVPDMTVRHLDIAMPRGRKTDPAGFPWTQFKIDLYPPATRAYVVRGLPVYQRSDRTGPLWGYLAPGEVVAIDDLSNGHLADSRGFVDINGLQVQA